jgi:hypothetical protein
VIGRGHGFPLLEGIIKYVNYDDRLLPQMEEAKPLSLPSELIQEGSCIH